MDALYVGLMSGTSMDGVDAALCRFSDARFVRVVATHSIEYTSALRQQLLAAQRTTAPISLNKLAELDGLTADTFSKSVVELLSAAKVSASQITAIGSHGQTVFHDPLIVRSSLQLGDPNRIAANTGITTVADFRRKDIALGGQGAPLVPAFHHACFHSSEEARCVLNLGGIANITLLPISDAVRGFDAGPGNGLIDEWAQLHLGQAFDTGGNWGAAGALHSGLLNCLLEEPYFQQPPPKSTGRGQFNLEWVRGRYPHLDALPSADVQNTLTELTARTAVDALRQHAPDTQRLLVCGGGVRNDLLMQRLSVLAQIPVESTDLHGLSAQWVEAAAFAWLAMRSLHRLPGNLPAVTGACREAVLGGIYYP